MCRMKGHYPMANSFLSSTTSSITVLMTKIYQLYSQSSCFYIAIKL